MLVIFRDSKDSNLEDRLDSFCLVSSGDPEMMGVSGSKEASLGLN